jgi:glycyl-tRNA synthetase
MNSADVLSLCKRRGFIWPAYEIYGGIAGLYDYGPMGAAMKNNIIHTWRKAYTLGEGFVEIDADTIGPEIVFKASGHLDQFSDASSRRRGSHAWSAGARSPRWRIST